MDIYVGMTKTCIYSLLIFSMSNAKADSAYSWGAWDISGTGTQIITPDVPTVSGQEVISSHQLKSDYPQRTATTTIANDPSSTIVQLHDGSSVQVSGGTVSIDGNNISIVGDNVTITSVGFEPSNTVTATGANESTVLMGAGTIQVPTAATTIITQANPTTFETINITGENNLTINQSSGAYTLNQVTGSAPEIISGSINTGAPITLSTSGSTISTGTLTTTGVGVTATSGFISAE